MFKKYFSVCSKILPVLDSGNAIESRRFQGATGQESSCEVRFAFLCMPCIKKKQTHKKPHRILCTQVRHL